MKTIAISPVTRIEGHAKVTINLDESGLITNVNLIVGTTHNNAPINMSVKQAAKTTIKNGNYDQGILNKVEMAIRAYDPCLSCATHKLDGSIAVKLEIRDARGELIDTVANW